MSNTIRSQVKDLWKLCFNDSDEFIDLYFNLRFNAKVNVSMNSGNQIIAALQMLPYSFTFFNAEFQSWYISGACTHPDFRNKGVMRKLISEAFAKMSMAGVAFSALIPAEDWLFDYYEKLGYAPVFKCTVKDVIVNPLKESNNTVEKIVEFRPDVYKYFNQKMHKRNCCIQHTENDIKVVIEDMKIDKGFILVASREGNIVGIAFIYLENHTFYIAELLADTDKVKQQLIQAVQKENRNYKIKLIAPYQTKTEAEPLGMIRIINVPKVLQIYALNHPDITMNITLYDPMLSSNNNYYYLYKGKCMISKERLPGKHVSFTMKELASFIFEDTKPYMSLMMD